MARSVRTNVMLHLGLISTPVSVATALDTPDEVKLNTLCTTGHDPVKAKMRLYCPTCDNDDRASFVKGRDVGGAFVVIDPEDLPQPADADKNTITLTTHPAADLSETMPGGKAYFLTPQKGTGEGYPLLVEMVRKHPEYAFVATFAVRSVTALYRLGVHGNALTLTELAWPENVRSVDGGDLPYNEALVPLAEQFIADLASPFDPDSYRDDRVAKLREFVANATPVAAGDAPADEVPAAVGNVADLMAALQAAVDDKRPPAAEMTKAELSERAKQLGIKGRSKMSKDELAEAVQAAA